MQVFSRNFFVTAIWLQTMFSVYCQQDGLECHFDVIKDEREVEKVVVEYLHKLNVQLQAETPYSLYEIYTFALDLGPESPPQPQPSEETTDLDIGQLSKEDKLTACAEILKLNYFGLDIRPEDTEMAGSTQEISFKHTETVPLANTRTTLFECPQLQYTDLETGNTVRVPTTYFISNSHLENSFVLYHQDGSNPAIYPHKLASSVYLAHFHRLREDFETIETRDRNEAGKIEKMDEVPKVMEHLSTYLGIRKTEKVYDKFQNLFNNLSVCALPRTHLIAVCRYVARDMEMEVDHRAYDKSKCENQPVFATTGASAGPGSDFIDAIPMAECPVMYTHTKETPFKMLTIFLSAYQLRNSAIAYLRPNRQQRIVPSALITSMGLHMLQKDTNRRRELLKPEIGSSNESGGGR